jgi:lysyl-tRNA synthetase class 2
MQTTWMRATAAMPVIVFWYIRLSGIVSILAWVSQGLIYALAGIWALRWIGYLGWVPSLPYGLLLILLSYGIRRRKKAAWRIVCILFVLIFLLAIATAVQSDGAGGEIVTAVVFGIAFVLLLFSRHEFDTLPDRANRRLALTVFTGFLLFAVVIGTVLVFLTDQNSIGGPWTYPVYALLQTAFGAAVSGNPIDVDVAGWVDGVLGIMGGTLLFFTVWALFKPARGEAILTPEEELPARTLLAEYGDQDSLGYFALRRDKDVILAPNRRAAISYRVEGPVCLASGDPLGDSES